MKKIIFPFIIFTVCTLLLGFSANALESTENPIITEYATCILQKYTTCAEKYGQSYITPSNIEVEENDDGRGGVYITHAITFDHPDLERKFFNPYISIGADFYGQDDKSFDLIIYDDTISTTSIREFITATFVVISDDTLTSNELSDYTNSIVTSYEEEHMSSVVACNGYDVYVDHSSYVDSLEIAVVDTVYRMANRAAKVDEVRDEYIQMDYQALHAPLYAKSYCTFKGIPTYLNTKSDELYYEIAVDEGKVKGDYPYSSYPVKLEDGQEYTFWGYIRADQSIIINYAEKISH